MKFLDTQKKFDTFIFLNPLALGLFGVPFFKLPIYKIPLDFS